MLLALISVMASLSVALIISVLNYQVAIDNTYLRLQDTVRSQARLIEAIIRHEATQDIEQVPVHEAVDAVMDAHKSYTGFGETGEFALASLDNGTITFIVQQRVGLAAPAAFVANEVAWAEPMKRALQGESGVILAKDYRGKTVLAAFEPVTGTNLGLVAKIDRQEIIDRFVPAVLAAMGIALIVALLSVSLFVKLGDPLIRRLRSQKDQLRKSIKQEKSVAGSLRYREQQQRAIVELGDDVIQGIDIDDLLIKAAAMLAGMLGMEFANILELRSESDDLLLRAGVGWQQGLVGKATVPASGHSQAALTLRSKQPVVVADMGKERRISAPELLIQHGVRCGISAIIGDNDSPWGVLGVHGKNSHRFDEADIFFVQSLANLLNNAISRSEKDEELRKWNVLFKNAGWGMSITDSTTGRLIAVNPMYAKMHGYTVDEAQSVFPEDYRVPGQDIAAVKLAGEVGTESTETYEVTRIRKDGSTFPAIVNEVAIFDESGAGLYSVANIQDSTELKNIEMERLAVERKVQHAQKLESLGVLAGGIAHDFNNILMTILGNISVAMEDVGPEAPARASLEAVEDAARRAASLAKQMLAYSGKGQFVIEDLAINDLVDEIAHLLEVSVSKNVILKYSLGPNLPKIRGDASQISQILMNLIINASDAIGEKSGVIQVSTGVKECDRDYLDTVALEFNTGMGKPLAEGLYNYFLVSDTGCGMNARTIAKIFDPFFTTKFAGRGLGLAAMLGIVRAHSGAIKIYSELGKGTTFKVLLPASTSIDDGDATENQVDASQNLWRGSGVVLIADDDESIIALGKRMLERLGYTALAASNGVEAVDLYREQKDVIVCAVLDLTMPQMSGSDAFSEIRRINPDAKIILCSGYDEKQVTQEFAGRGLAGFLHKPYTIKELKNKFREVLG